LGEKKKHIVLATQKGERPNEPLPPTTDHQGGNMDNYCLGPGVAALTWTPKKKVHQQHKEKKIWFGGVLQRQRQRKRGPEST